MRPSHLSNFVVFGLGLLLLGQLWYRPGRDETSLPEGLYPGMPVPELDVRRLAGSSQVSLGHLVGDVTACTLLVIVRPLCPTCARMRVTWPSRFAAWADSVAAQIQPVWLSVGGHDALEAFVTGYRLQEAGITLVSVPEGFTSATYDALGVLGTPTLYLVRPDGTVVAGLIGDRLPPVALAAEACL